MSLVDQMISVIVCTYNRSNSLRLTLKRISEISVPLDMSWELIVVDNNSSDNTKLVIDDFLRISNLNGRYVFEVNQGLSYARNRGIEEAKGEIIAFTDDDVLVDKNWLRFIETAFKENNADCIGGKILPNWEKPCPKWLTKDFHGPLALLDYGEKTFFMDTPYLWGANLSFKKELFRKYGKFNTVLGRKPGTLFAGEETEFIRTLLENGKKILYLHEAIVYHFVPSTRMRKSYFRRWQYAQGELKAIMMGSYRYRNIFGVPFYVVKDLFIRFSKWVLHYLKSDSFLNETSLSFILGFVVGRLKLRLKGEV